MKISVLQSHPAYHDWAFKVCRFFLDGVPRNNVLFADEERRYAITRRLDEFGNTASAGSLIAFSRHSEDLPAGAYGMLASFGAGYSLGALLMQRQ